MNPRFRRAAAASAVVLAMLAAAPAYAGTTGSLSGIVTDAAGGAPVAGATVTATSPTQIARARTDANGRFALVSLAPDEYTLAVDRNGYDPLAIPGVAIFADAQQTLTLAMHRKLAVIARVLSRTPSGLVRPGTTADLYSVDAAQQARTGVLGGGGDLNSAYSAIAAVPGAYVPANQTGYLQAVHVRGGDADQIGYEIDGVPVNRAFDNYPSGSVSSLGQLELQVYTGATPAVAEAQGLAGFVNQVLKTGTFPGFAFADAGAGTPSFYHSLDVEAGGATPDRSFSYYLGIGGYNQEHRYVDQFNGASEANEFGAVLKPCPPAFAGMPPSCLTNGAPNQGASGSPGYVLGPVTFAGISPDNVATRTTVINLHAAIPHRSDSGRDDVQLLYQNDTIFTALLSSPDDAGLGNFATGPGTSSLPSYLDSYQYTGATGRLLPADYPDLVKPYFFPSSPTDRVVDAPIPPDQRDVGYNDQGIVKLQYQHNFGSNAYFRVYGYSYYSDYITTGADSSYQHYTGYDSGDYEENAHTRGVSASFTDQLDARNLLSVQGSYTTATALRVFNEQMFSYGDDFAVLVNPNAIDGGTCYAIPAGATHGVAAPTTCSSGLADVVAGGSPTFLSLAAAAQRSQAGLPPSPVASNFTCGGATCAFYVAGNGQFGDLNAVRPAFYGSSIEDQWRPGDRWSVSAGVRLDAYQFDGGDTTGTAARAFWFDAFDQDTCFDTRTQSLVDRTVLLGSGPWSTSAARPCSSFGAQYANASLSDVSNQQFVYDVVQPRLGATYSASADTVLRASFGKYNEQPTSAYQQYDSLEQNLPDTLSQFYGLGFDTPGHAVAPSISYNSDFSLEHRFKNSGLSLKLTPFLRQTHGQIENFYTNLKADLISGLNVGRQTSRGFELGVAGGDFARDGFAGQLSFAYTNAYVRYGALPSNSSILAPIEADIEAYNAFTKFCARHAGDDRCGSGDPQHPVAAPCYTVGGEAVANAAACTVRDVANPYWNAPVQPLLDPNADYVPYTIFPGAIGTSDNGFDYPYVATLVLNYKRGRWAVTPSLQFEAGNRYGAPETMPGIDPAAVCAVLPGSTAHDPRYPYGAAGGSPYDADPAGACTPGRLDAIPDSYTGQFDGIGAFREPAQLLGHLRFEYRVSAGVSVTLTLANLLQTCFGGQNTPFTYYWNDRVCSYTGINPTISPAGNLYNPGSNVQSFLRYPYEPSFGVYNDIGASTNQPFTAYLQARLRL